MADKKQEGMYVANRDVTLRTTTGHVIGFEKDKPVFVPPEIRDHAQMIGVVPVDGTTDYSAAEVVREKKQIPVGNTRVRLIKEAITEMIVDTENASANFTGTGLPKTDVLTRKLGFPVDSKERSNIFKNMRAEGAFD